MPIADCRLPIAECRLPIAECRLPIADCQLPIAIGYCLSLIQSKNDEFCRHRPDSANWQSEIGNRKYPHSAQSAINTFVSPRTCEWRLDAKTSFLPSGENIGKPSNVSLNVMRSRPLPS